MNENSYCKNETLEGITRQRDYFKANKYAAYKTQSFLITPSQVKFLSKKIICDKCDRKVDEVIVECFLENRWARFIISCHGKEERHELTELQYIYLIGSKSKMIAFLDPKKQVMREAMEWMDGLLNKKQLLLK